MKPYISPADPSFVVESSKSGASSYAYNYLVFPHKDKKPLRKIDDGESTTIIFAEHYAFKCKGAQFKWFWSDDPQYIPFNGELLVIRRASFADVGDIVPITSGNPPVSVGSQEGLTFQTRPRIEDCNPTIPQAPYAAGLLVALGDGSVRTLSPRISPTTFWSAVTPAGGESLGNDW